jgi:uncharacterized protein YndB with AHSA1/START domain
MPQPEPVYQAFVGGGHSFGGEYLELIPGSKICYTDKFDEPNIPN